MGAPKTVLYLFNRYAVSVTFPTFTAVCIYADLKHTRDWKAELAKHEGGESKS